LGFKRGRSSLKAITMALLLWFLIASLFLLERLPDALYWPLLDLQGVLLAYYAWYVTPVVKRFKWKNLCAVLLASLAGCFVFNLISDLHPTDLGGYIFIAVAAPVAIFMYYLAQSRFINQPPLTRSAGYFYHLVRLPRSNLEYLGFALTYFTGGAIKTIVNDDLYYFSKKSGMLEKTTFDGVVPNGYKMFAGKKITDRKLSRLEEKVGTPWGWMNSCILKFWIT